MNGDHDERAGPIPNKMKPDGFLIDNDREVSNLRILFRNAFFIGRTSIFYIEILLNYLMK